MPHGTARWSAIVPMTFGAGEVGAGRVWLTARRRDVGSGDGVPLPSTFLSAAGSTCAHAVSTSATRTSARGRFIWRG